jgi:hypothetical protein
MNRLTEHIAHLVSDELLQLVGLDRLYGDEPVLWDVTLNMVHTQAGPNLMIVMLISVPGAVLGSRCAVPVMMPIDVRDDQVQSSAREALEMCFTMRTEQMSMIPKVG